MMRHKDDTPKPRYIDVRHQMNGVTDLLEVPDLGVVKRKVSSGAWNLDIEAMVEISWIP